MVPKPVSGCELPFCESVFKIHGGTRTHQIFRSRCEMVTPLCGPKITFRVKAGTVRDLGKNLPHISHIIAKRQKP